ncbi:carboxymuconolactone decarboxylase family protein [Kitasatospora sp. NPDC008050]|uniref:carboxymuconolactone decarboxylase family protein n=1 Tax=Kitasatospora sp. NPDC008050 TaxID=3364021 RepID=UPI0036EE0FB0
MHTSEQQAGDDRTQRERGLEVAEAFAGADMVDHVRAAFADTAPEFVDYMVDFVFGEVYARPGLSPVERQIASIVALTTLGGADFALKNHIEIGLRVGMDPAKVVATIMQALPHAGFARVAEAMLMARRVFAEQDLHVFDKPSGAS